MRSVFLAFITLLFIHASTIAQTTRAAAAHPDISFTVSMPRPFTHLLEVEMNVSQAANAPKESDLVMPVWTPGSYLIREYERHVQDFVATDASGRALPWRKVNKNTWRVETNGAREWRAQYRVYANELTVRTSEFNDHHAFWNNAALLMYVDGHLNAPARLRVLPIGDWKVATGLPEIAGEPNTFGAENFDVLYDSPFEVSNFKTLAFEVKGVKHRIVIDGEGNYDTERLTRDVQKIVATQAAMMGETPYKDYTFLIHLTPSGSGGTEHLNSTAIILNRTGFKPDAEYHRALGTISHEFFHLWNVKRIRPDALGPFDYTRENYTRLLWVAEGLTSYYGPLLLHRAGLTSDAEFLSSLARSIQTLQTTPGRFEMSVEEASFDAWIKYYRPDENTPNSEVSYYNKGSILGLLLDLEIRGRTHGTKSLDDVMRYLYAEFYKKNRNYTPEDFQRAVELAAGSSLEQFFSAYVRGREEIDYNSALARVGLRLDTGSAANSRTLPERSVFGIDITATGERLTVSHVYSGTPAYEQGVSANDQIIALDGARIPTRDFFNTRLAEKRAGDIVRVTVFRSDDLRTIEIKLAAPTEGDYRLIPIAQPTEEQKRLYQDWIK